MKIKIFCFILGIILFSAALSSAQGDLLEAVDKVRAEKHVLDNGLIVIIKEDHTAPLAAIEARVGAGSTTEGEFSGSGITHFLEHMLFKGTVTMEVGEIEKAIKAFGGTINGFTSHDYTGYRIVVLKEHLRRTLEITKDILFFSTIDPKELEKERGVILKEIKLNRDDPARHLMRLLWSTVYREHPYHYPIIGYENLFKDLGRADLLKYYERTYAPNNITLAIVGDVDSESLYVDIHDIFGSVERGIPRNAQTPVEPKQVSKRTLKKKEDIKLAYFGLAFRSIDLFNEDLYALDVLAMILGEGASSRLNQKLYREGELVYSIGAWNYTPRDPGIFVISGVCEPEKVSRAEKAIWAEIDKIKNGDINPEELAKAKNSVLASYISSRETVSGQASDLASSEAMTGDYDFSKTYLNGINRVELDDITQAAREYLQKDRLSFISFLPESYEEEKDTSEPPEAEKTVIKEHTFSNGLKVLLGENHRLPMVSINVLFNGGLRSENEGTNGICNLTASMLLKGNTSRTEEEISRIVESLGGSIGYISGNNSFGISLSLLKRDVDIGLDLLKDILFSSTFPKDILEREKNSVLAAIKSEEDDIYRFTMRLLKENLFEQHPYRFRTIGNEESIQEIDRKAVVNYYKKWCRPNNMVLSVFGDINSGALLSKIEKRFSTVKKTILPAISPPQEKIPQAKKEIHKSLNKEQSVVMIGFPATTIYDKDKYVLTVISSILSGKSGRIAAEIREKMGLAYTLGSYSLPGVDPGYYLFYVGTSPGNVPRVTKELLKQIKILSSRPVSDEELDLAKSELIGSYQIHLQANSALGFHVALDELYGLGYENYLKYPASIKIVTKDDILRVAGKFFNPKAYTMVVVEGNKN